MKRLFAIAFCLCALYVFASDAPSGFLSDYGRLTKQASIRARYMGDTAPGAADFERPTVYVTALGRFPLA